MENNNFTSPDLSAESAFSNLSSDLGFSTAPQKKEEKVKTPQVIVISRTLEVVSILSILALAIAWGDVLVRSRSDELPAGVPPILCPVILRGITTYDSSEDDVCQTPKSIITNYSTRAEEIRKKTAEKLAEYLSAKYIVSDPTSLPEVRFIEKLTGPERVRAADIIARFEAAISKYSTLTNNSTFLAKCQGISYEATSNEVTTSCQVYGQALVAGAPTSNSSRIGALSFLRFLSLKESGFEVLETPRTLAI